MKALQAGRLSGTMHYDRGSEAGEIKLHPKFRGEDPLFRLDVLKDWMGELQDEYNRAFQDFKDQVRAARAASDEQAQQ